jgi:hypothetical protein
MRSDMKKVLCESPRSHSSCCYHEVRQKETRGDHEDLPTHQGMRRPYGYDNKDFTDHIMPLYRYLWSCVGRPYDEVWSEICAAVPSNNTVDQHLKGHVKDELTINMQMVDGVLWEYSKYGTTRQVRGLYVDPGDGIIRATAPDRDNAYSYKEKRDYIRHRGMSYLKDENGVLIPSDHFYHSRNGSLSPRFPVKPLGQSEDAMKINGLWYRVTIATVPPVRVLAYTEDGQTKYKHSPQSRFDVVYRCTVWSDTVYHATKRQMAFNDLRKHKLVND